MDVRCPSCHSTFTLEQVAEDEALRELMGIIADLPRETSRPLAAYIGLFRGKSRRIKGVIVPGLTPDAEE